MLQNSNAFESERVLIYAPFGRDGALIQSELQAAGLSAGACTSMAELCALIHEGAGAALIGDEALVPSTIQCLVDQLAQQPPWSDFPLLVMTLGSGSTQASRHRLSLLEPLGNVTLLERPLSPVTLVSTMRAALRARRRQYQLAEHLTKIESAEQALRKSEARFRFLSELGEETRSVPNPDFITPVVARRLGEHLRVSRCAYATVESDSEEFTILHDYTARGCSSTTGKYHLSLFGPGAVTELQNGRTLVIRNVDVELAPGQGREMFSSIGIKAIICCPLVKDSQLVAMMAVHQTIPRDWTQDEVELVEQVVERCWAYIERERLVAEVAANNEVLQLTNQDLSRVNRELEEFAYVASHDLQEPLRMVKIYTQLIAKRLAGSDQTITQLASVVQQGAERMDTLIRDLLTFSRTVHSETPAVGVADLSASLAEAMAVLKSRIEENGAIVEAQGLPNARGETPQIAHVFQNLISNSIKYRKPNEPPEIHISAEQQDSQWVMAVRDNGIGFDQKHAERIFGLFKRLHKDEYPGTGLGLAICQRIVERYGGHMWAKSKSGEGATFYFTLPCT